MASGRLWMPALPQPDFFESFYILVRPAYCSKYFPGTALFFVPTVWLHWPTWLMPAMASGACVALVYRIVAELIDGACGVLAALMMVSLSWFRMLSVLLLSNVPMLLFALLLYWSWLRWRKSRSLGSALAMGAFAGWGAITRPIDAIAVSLPVALAVLFELTKHPASKGNARKWLATILCGVGGAAPFLAIQIIFNVGVTGHLFQTPYGYYIDRNQPNTSYGFHKLDANATVESSLPQKREYYEQWVEPFIARHRPANLARAWASKYWPMIVDVTMPCRLLLVFLPIGLLALRDLQRWVLFSIFPLFILLYVFSTFFLEHYAVLVAPAVILGVLLGGRELSGAWPVIQRRLFAAFTMAIAVMSLTSLWEINRLVTSPATRISDETFISPILRYVNEILPFRDDVTKPAVILFTYHPGGNFFEEPVYNTDVAWPDDAPIIHAHDLGSRNREIFAYYAKTQPTRTFYRFDLGLAKQGKEPLIRLGTARELAGR
jgi:4-amino-4-deoxy-L-arabinose transferase-like glycosyltransferase